MANAPTIASVRAELSSAVAISWLEIQILDLSTYVGVREKMDDMQMRGLAELITGEYYDLKLTELMLFFTWLKIGKYGKFYGVVDPQVVGEALGQFARERAKKLFELEKKKQAEKALLKEREREQMDKRGELMSYTEFKELEWLFNI